MRCVDLRLILTISISGFDEAALFYLEIINTMTSLTKSKVKVLESQQSYSYYTEVFSHGTCFDSFSVAKASSCPIDFFSCLNPHHHLV